MDELLQLAVRGGDIDGQVLAYLELAQVCPLSNYSNFYKRLKVIFLKP